MEKTFLPNLCDFCDKTEVNTKPVDYYKGCEDHQKIKEEYTNKANKQIWTKGFMRADLTSKKRYPKLKINKN